MYSADNLRKENFTIYIYNRWSKNKNNVIGEIMYYFFFLNKKIIFN